MATIEEKIKHLKTVAYDDLSYMSESEKVSVLSGRIRYLSDMYNIIIKEILDSGKEN